MAYCIGQHCESRSRIIAEAGAGKTSIQYMGRSSKIFSIPGLEPNQHMNLT
jgi:hypothetical protein